MGQATTRGSVCVVIAAREGDEHLDSCLESVRAHTPADVPILTVPATTAAVNRALEQQAPADVALLSEPCRVTAGWLGSLRNAACADTNTATASAFSDAGTALALSDADRPPVDLLELADSLAVHTLGLRPRLNQAVGPCVYLRCDALELVGPLDEELALRWALEIDFAQRCVLSGLAHVAADDVVVGQLERAGRGDSDEVPARLRERYPYLPRVSTVAASGVLLRALEAARRPRPRLWVTIDARALDGALTGTQVHVLELICALAQTRALRLRLIVLSHKIDRATLDLLRELPETEVLGAEEIDEATPRSAVFHRPQQTFSPGDVELALRLGERIVVSQLDLIAYSNPGYFTDADASQDYRRASRHGLSAAERVVVFSEHTRRELLSDALVEDERIRVVPPGLDHRSTVQPLRPAALAADLPDFLLCLGTDFRHKNRVFALRLLAALREDHDWQGSLLLAGTHIPVGSSLELEQAFLAEHSELREAVVTLGSVSEQEKTWLMGHAQAVVYPSVYEGFGLVPFEAALSGVPCMFAPQSSLAEVAPAKTAAIVPWNIEQSAARVHALLSDPAARASHVQELAGRARSLTWANTAEALVEIYREAVVAPVRDAATLSRDAMDRERRSNALHEATVQMLEQRYEQLVAEVGPARSLIGPRGALPDDLQRALLALSARPTLSRPLFGAPARVFAAARAVDRARRRLRRAG
jgi:glycosyltransferase involved in cell wall biosynthesis